MIHLRNAYCLVALLALAPLASAVPDANGAVSSTAAPDLAADSAMLARLNYNLGFERFEQTQQLEMGAGALKGAQAREAQQAVRKGYTEARERFRTAVAADPDVKEAWNLIGYTSRRLGEYEDSLAAYDAALKLQPDYPEAIEYRAELFLLTGRLDDARSAFAQLVGSSPSYANVLLQSMRDWLAAPVQTSAAVSAEQRAAFAAWVGAQKPSAL